MIQLDETTATSGAATEVRRAVTHLARRLRAERTDRSMSSGKVSVLSHLARVGPMTPGQLAAVEFVQPQSLTRMLAELESDDLVVRRAHPRDGRQYLEEITKAGRAALMVDLESRDPWLDRAMDALTPAERELLGIAARLMERMAETE